MKKFFILLFFLIFLMSFDITFADQIDLLSSYWDFYGINYNNFVSLGLGMSTLSDIGGAEYSLQNPASVNAQNNNTFFSIGYKNKIALADTLIMKAKNPIIFFNYTGSYKNLVNYSIGFEQTKSFQITNNLENQTYLKNKKLFYRDNTYFLSANYKRIKFLKIGTSLLIKTLYLDEETGSAYIDRFKKNIILFKCGILLIPIRNLNFALTYIPGTEYKISVLNSDDETFTTNNKTLPPRLKFGLSYKYKNLGVYYQQDFEKTSEDFYFLKDKINYHIGISYTLSKYMKFTGGFFTNNSSFNPDNQLLTNDLPEVRDEFFLSGGVILYSDLINFGISFADSHFSNAYTPKTYISAGFSYNFITLF